MLNSMELYEKIEKIRVQKGIPVAKLNKAAGISHSTLSSWKTRQTMPKIESLDSICFALGISLAELLYDIDSDKLTDKIIPSKGLIRLSGSYPSRTVTRISATHYNRY